jgi:hypothetical protein
MILGGCICRAIARVVVMSIMLLSAGSNNKLLKDENWAVEGGY